MAKAWNYHSHVTQCRTCEGHGVVRSYRQPTVSDPYPENDCPDCDGPHEPECDVCGYNLPVAGFDCLACDTVAGLNARELKAFDRVAFANAVAVAVRKALADSLPGGGMSIQPGTPLTKQERKTLDDAQAIIAAHTPEGKASWSFAFHANGMFGSSCYFDSQGGQHMLWTASSFADAVCAGIQHELAAEKDAANIKAIRIARLKDELRELGEVAA